MFQSEYLNPWGQFTAVQQLSPQCKSLSRKTLPKITLSAYKIQHTVNQLFVDGFYIQWGHLIIINSVCEAEATGASGGMANSRSLMLNFLLSLRNTVLDHQHCHPRNYKGLSFPFQLSMSELAFSEKWTKHNGMLS